MSATPSNTAPASVATPAMSDAELADLKRLVLRLTGIALGDAKRPLLVMRLADRLAHHRLGSFAEYLELIEREGADGPEIGAMIHRVTTHKTDFFREPHHFDYLNDVVLPAALANGCRKPRIWCAAASTGEEPYSLAMVLAGFARRHAGVRPNLLATDIDAKVIETAERGVYGVERMAGVPSSLWQPHVDMGKGKYTGQVRMSPALREMISFRTLNLTDDSWPIEAGFDAIFCRNVLIYFDPETREQIVARLKAMLKPGGWLMLGHAETLQRQSVHFERCRPTIYRLADTSPAAADNQHAGTNERRWPGDPALQRVEIVVGDVHASETPTQVRTLLGSCVSVALWDDVSGIGGMNHFLVPGMSDDGPPGRFGGHALDLLLAQLAELGARPRRLRAKIFGGARTLRSDMGVGEENIAFARSYLEGAGIPIVSERCGGDAALEVYFQTHDGRAFCRRRYGTFAPAGEVRPPRIEFPVLPGSGPRPAQR